MIAQKVVDAKQSQIPRRPAIAAPNPGAAALGTPTLEHFSTPPFAEMHSASPKRAGIQGGRRLVVLEPFCSGAFMALCVARRARNNSISLVTRSAAAPRSSV